MRGKEGSTIVAISLAILLMLGVVPLVSHSADLGVIITGTPHAPIRINSNVDFDEAHGVANWATGNGTIWNPWIIEEWDINSTNYNYCLYIGNTTDFFIVANCSLHDTNGVSWSYPYFYNTGLFLYNVINGIIVDNWCGRNDIGGIVTFNSNNIKIIDNHANYNGYYGILLESTNSMVVNNTVSYNGERGINIWGTNNRIENNTATHNVEDGITIISSFNNVIKNCNLSYNGDTGINIGDSSFLTLTGNELYDNGIVIGSSLLEDHNTHMIDTSNSVNGKPVYYYKNTSGITVPPGAGQVIMANCSFMTVINQNVSKASCGILLAFSSNNTIRFNTANSNNISGIRLLWDSNNNIIMNNTVDLNDRGIFIHYSNNNNLSGNNFYGNHIGIYNSGASNSTIWHNIITHSDSYGISIVGDYNNIGQNQLTDNQVGIWLASLVENNKIYNNVIINNWYGIRCMFYSCSNATANIFSKNYIMENKYGFYSRNTDYNIITDNLLSMNTEYGIYMRSSDNNTIFNNIIKDMKGEEAQDAVGLYLSTSSNNLVKSNDIHNISGGDCTPSGGFPASAYGIQLDSSSDNVIVKNNVSDIKNGEWVYFRDDMEGGSGKWEHSSTVMLVNGEEPLEYFYDTLLDTDIISGWNNTVSVGLETTTETYHSFNISFYMNETNNNKTAVTETFSLVNLEKANLKFWQKYNLTSDENGGFLQVGYKDPANGGVSDWDWKYITPAMYTGNLNASDQVNDSFGTPISECWNGISDNGTFDWEYVGIDILDQVPIAYRSEVRIKFNFTNLGGAGTGGWYLDDVRLLVSRDENVTITGDDKDVWNLTNTMAHSGNYCWSNIDPVTGYMKPGIDNYLTTKPIDLSGVINANFTAYLKFNINEDSGAPPDGFRVEVSTDSGLSWFPINLGVRAGWGVSGTGLDIDDGAMDGKAYTGLPESGDPVADDYWINISSLSRVNADLSSFSGNVIQIRFRVVNSNNVTYEHNNNHNQPDPGFGGFYVDDVEVHAVPIFPPLTDSKAISLGNSFDNIIYHNNFINNGDNAEDDGINFWDNDYPSGGNYWDDYTGIDQFSGPNQDLPGSDGIGDTNYTNIYGGVNVDNYPLMMPFGYEFTCTNITLSEGWNLISLPLTQCNESIVQILSSIDGKWDYIQAYDALDPDHWKTYATFKPSQLNDLHSLNHKMGFWINITEPNVNLTVRGYIPSSTSIPLYAGWNLVGYPSLNASVTIGDALWGTSADRVEVCDIVEPYNIREVGPTYVMKPGEGYWIHVPADTLWIVDW